MNDPWGQSGIVNTRHNLTQSPAMGANSVLMDNYRNNYTEICVYCLTPHAANASVPAPLWNRNFPATTYATYDQLNTATLTQTVYQPGAASLMCLSCHDGQQAVDAIRNMPGSGGYSATPNEAFLDSWDNPGRFGGGHLSLGTPAWGPSGFPGINFPTTTTCLTCHSPGVDGNTLSGSGQDFTVAAIGTDLRDDHPVGVTFPAFNGAGTAWKTPNASVARAGYTTAFFDENGNSRMDKGEIRLYDSGNGPLVECASCHDPHEAVNYRTGFQRSEAGSPVALACGTSDHCPHEPGSQRFNSVDLHRHRRQQHRLAGMAAARRCAPARCRAARAWSGGARRALRARGKPAQ